MVSVRNFFCFLFVASFSYLALSVSSYNNYCLSFDHAVYHILLVLIIHTPERRENKNRLVNDEWATSEFKLIYGAILNRYYFTIQS